MLGQKTAAPAKAGEIGEGMKKITVLVNTVQQKRIFLEEHYERLRKLGNLHIYDKEDFSDRQYTLDFVKNTDFLIIAWWSPKLEKDILDACPSLSGVAYGGGTLINTVSDEFVKRNIPISNSKIVDSKNVGEATLGLAIAACKGAFFLPNDLRNGLWKENYHKVKDFCGIKIGVVGAGVAGGHFLNLLDNFEVEKLVYDPTLSEDEIKNRFNARKCELSELMTESDVISLHAPVLPATKNMINAENLRLIKDGAIFINTARGALVDEKALIVECRKNRFTAILDVTNSGEPMPEDCPLRSIESVVLLPHITGVTNNGVKFMGKHICEETERFFAGETMKCMVDLTKLSEMA